VGGPHRDSAGSLELLVRSSRGIGEHRLRAMGRGVDRGIRIIPRLLFAFWAVAFWGMMLQTSTMLERWERTRGLPDWALALVMWAIALGGVISGVAAGVIVVS